MIKHKSNYMYYSLFSALLIAAFAAGDIHAAPSKPVSCAKARKDLDTLGRNLRSKKARLERNMKMRAQGSRETLRRVARIRAKAKKDHPGVIRQIRAHGAERSRLSRHMRANRRNCVFAVNHALIRKAAFSSPRKTTGRKGTKSRRHTLIARKLGRESAKLKQERRALSILKRKRAKSNRDRAAIRRLESSIKKREANIRTLHNMLR